MLTILPIHQKQELYILPGYNRCNRLLVLRRRFQLVPSGTHSLLFALEHPMIGRERPIQQTGMFIKIVIGSNVNNSISTLITNLNIHWVGKWPLSDNRLWLCCWDCHWLRFNIDCAAIAALKLDWILRETKYLNIFQIDILDWGIHLIDVSASIENPDDVTARL